MARAGTPLDDYTEQVLSAVEEIPVGNVMTYEQEGKQYVGVLSGVGGWAGIGLAAGLTGPTDGLGAASISNSLGDFTALGGQLTVFALPD